MDTSMQVSSTLVMCLLNQIHLLMAKAPVVYQKNGGGVLFVSVLQRDISYIWLNQPPLEQLLATTSIQGAYAQLESTSKGKCFEY